MGAQRSRDKDEDEGTASIKTLVRVTSDSQYGSSAGLLSGTMKSPTSIATTPQIDGRILTVYNGESNLTSGPGGLAIIAVTVPADAEDNGRFLRRGESAGDLARLRRKDKDEDWSGN